MAVGRKKPKSPERKVVSGALTGALAAVSIWSAEEFGGTDIPAHIASSVTTIFSVIVMYFVPSK